MMTASGGVWGLRLFTAALLLWVGEEVSGASTWDWKRLFASEEKEVTSPREKIGKLSNKKFNKDIHMYRIEGDGANTIFIVNDQGDIAVNDKLDREEKSLYHLRARLINRQTNMDVEDPEDFSIQVQDINDNAPVFQGPFKGYIEEMSAMGTMVMKVNATDKDDPTTSNGMVRYMLLNGTDVFSIAEKEGIITTKVANLDRETTSEYKIIVHAKDMPGHNFGLSSTATVTISVTDVNDNLSTFKMSRYTFRVREDVRPDFKIGTVEVEDKDEEQNKNPKFKIEDRVINDLLHIKQDQHKNGVFFLKQFLDYETRDDYRFTVFVTEDIVKFPGMRQNTNVNNKAEVIISVVDVDEGPVFTKPEYNISVLEETFPFVFREAIKAKDPDRDNHPIRYSIQDNSCPVEINSVTGTLSLKTKLDRELIPIHRCQVMAEESITDGKKSYVMVNLVVLDVNDNAPKLFNEEIYICESDGRGTILGTLSATDKDEKNGRFTFRLVKPSSNFSLTDNNNGTATLRVKQGHFNIEDAAQHVVDIEVGDGLLKSIEQLHISVCRCNGTRSRDYCRPHRQVGVSVHALITILLCIITILVIVILLVLRQRYRKDTLVALGKTSGEIHEQLVTYDEEGGGEMDTNGYDVSILTSARRDGTLLPGPGLYAMVNKPQACKGDMAAMIEVKKDEADHDRDGFPYDTLHIYGYEGPGSLAGSLSSLESSSSGDSLDYDFLNDWGPRFRTLAELYGVDSYPGDCPY